MDYLDPAKKRSHRIRLYIGYGLLTIAIAIATVILVYIGNGFYVDRDTGVLIQNGQLFINSDPDGAKIYLNGREQRTKTGGRFVVPSGTYTVTIKREGYRDWTAKDVVLDGGVVERLDYARLIPSTLTPAPQQTFATSPYAVTESINRRYLALFFAATPDSFSVMDLTKPEAVPKVITLPKALYIDPAKIGQLTPTEWAGDDKHFLVKNVFNGELQEYFIVSRETPDDAVNLTRDLRLAGFDFSLRDRAFDQYYAFNAATKVLDGIDLGEKSLKPVLTDVVDYKAYGDDSLLYVTSTGASEGKMQVRFYTGGKSYLMREVAVSPTYLLSIGRLGSTPVMAIGVPAENKVTILRDPLTYLRANTKQTIPLATTVLQLANPSEVSFSTDQTTVMARSGQNFATHNFDSDRTAKFTLQQPISAAIKVQWIDGKHISAVSGGEAYMFDFNGENVQKLVPSIEGLGSYFDNSYRSLFTFTAGANGKPFNVNRSSLTVKN